MFIAFNPCPSCGGHLNDEGECHLCRGSSALKDEEQERANLRKSPRAHSHEDVILPERGPEG